MQLDDVGRKKGAVGLSRSARRLPPSADSREGRHFSLGERELGPGPGQEQRERDIGQT